MTTPTQCTWTDGCTHKSLAGYSYCEEHYARVYQKGTARAKRKKEIRIVDKVRMVEQLMAEAIEQLEAEGFDVYGRRELGDFDAGPVVEEL